MAKNPHAVRIALLCAATLLAYANSFRCDFADDSRSRVLEDPRIRAFNGANLKLILTQNYWYPALTSGLYRPVTTLSFLSNYAVLGNGVDPAGYHAVNQALQCLNASLVYLLVWRLLGRLELAFAAAALWTLHPLLTESVTNIAGRADLLAGAAVLGGFLLHIRSGKKGSIAGLAAAATLGIFSKESVVVLPVLMAVYDVTFRRKIRWPAYAAVLLSFLFCWWIRSRVLAPHTHPLVDNPLLGAGFWTARLTALDVIGRYFTLLLFPVRLSNDYSYKQISIITSPGWHTLGTAFACAALLAIAILCYRRSKPLFFLMAFSAVNLLPASNLLVLIGSVMAERFLYLPAIGFAACLAAASCRIRRSGVANVALAVVCLAFACRTFARSFDWRDQETLAASGVAASPNSFKTHMARAMVLATKEPPDIAQATREIEQSMRILDGLPDADNVAAAYATAGGLYRQQGELQKSRDVLLRAAAIDAAAYRQYREQQLRSGVADSRIPPAGLPDVYLQLGETWLRLNEPRRALEAFSYGLRLAPDRPDLYERIAASYGALGDLPEQAIALLEGLILFPEDARLSSTLPALYARLDPSCPAAFREPGTGQVRLNAGCPLMSQHLCAARDRLIRLLAGVKQESEAQRLRARGDLRCPAAP